MRRRSFYQKKKTRQRRIVTYSSQITTKKRSFPLHRAFDGGASNDIDVSHFAEPHTHPIHSSKKGRYETSKQRLVDAWQSIREKLRISAVELYCPATFICQICNKDCIDRIIRCQDCSMQSYFCEDCCTKAHNTIQLHICEQWKDGSFNPFVIHTTFTPVGGDCSTCSTTYNKRVLVIDKIGRQHHAQVQYCKCECEAVQLRKYGLWPGSPTNPQVAFTIQLMEWLRLLQLECQVSVKGFTEMLKNKYKDVHETFYELKDVYKIMIQEAAAEYRFHMFTIQHLDSICPNFDDGTTCPACPTDESSKLIYSIDADFQLVRKHTSGRMYGKPKHTGRFFLAQEKVDKFVDTYNLESGGISSDECHNFQAGNNLRSKAKYIKLDETALFGSVCRHSYPKYFFSLKYGERLSYSVYLIEKLLQNGKMHILYDIACKLESHLKKNKREDLLTNITFGIPIFHCYGHQMSCQIKYSPKRISGLGLTDGEGIERLWSYLGRFSSITKEMSPENRVDLLTEALLYQGMKLKSKIGNLLVKKLRCANATIEESESDMSNFLQKLDGVNLDNVKQWSIEEQSMPQPRLQKEKLSNEEEYVILLEKYSTASSTLDVDRLNNIIVKQEKKCRIQDRWSTTSQIFSLTLNSAKRKTRKNMLTEMAQVSKKKKVPTATLR